MQTASLTIKQLRELSAAEPIWRSLPQNERMKKSTNIYEHTNNKNITIKRLNEQSINTTEGAFSGTSLPVTLIAVIIIIITTSGTNVELNHTNWSNTQTFPPSQRGKFPVCVTGWS